jgi:hypothetical protein
MAWTLIVSLLAVSYVSRGEECDSTAAETLGRHGMLQVTRARETIAAGNDNGDTASLLAMKAQLKSKLEMGEKLEPDETEFFTDFMAFLENTSLFNINETHRTDQEQINTAHAQFTHCSDELSRDQTSGQWHQHVTAKSDAENAHISCRNVEETLWPVPNETCHQNLDEDFVKPLDPPVSGYPGKEKWADPVMTTWLSEFHSWHCASPVKKDEFESLASTCSADAQAAKNQRILCKGKQHAFETAFCSLRTHVVARCGVYSGCHTDAVAEFNQVVSDNQAENEYLKVEYQIIKTIICYIKLLIGNAADITTEKKTECEGHYDDSFLDLTVPAIPAAVQCDAYSPVQVEPAPCAADFINQYYVQVLHATTPAAVCTPC